MSRKIITSEKLDRLNSIGQQFFQNLRNNGINVVIHFVSHIAKFNEVNKWYEHHILEFSSPSLIIIISSIFFCFLPDEYIQWLLEYQSVLNETFILNHLLLMSWVKIVWIKHIFLTNKIFWVLNFQIKFFFMILKLKWNPYCCNK